MKLPSGRQGFSQQIYQLYTSFVFRSREIKEQFSIKTNLFYDFIYIISGNEMRKEKSDLDTFWTVGRVDGKDLEMAALGCGTSLKRNDFVNFR
jgi:hypothetical protein